MRVVVRLPLKGFFHWSGKDGKRLDDVPGVSYSSGLDRMLKREFAVVVEHTDSAWRKTGGMFQGSDGSEVSLNSEQRLNVLDAIVIPSTRGATGYVGDEFIPDRLNVQVFTFEDGLAHDDVAAKIYMLTGVKVFEMQLEDGEPVIVRNAHEMVVSDTEQEEVQVSDVVKKQVDVEVRFPFQAVFCWHPHMELDLRLHPDSSKWSQPRIKAVVKKLNREKAFRHGATIYDYDVAWELVCGLTVKENRSVTALSDDEKKTLMEVLIMKGSRGVFGRYRKVDSSRPELGYVVDESLTVTVKVNYREDGDYHEPVKELVGKNMFGWKVI